MRKLTCIISILFLFIGMIGFAQLTPEQQKQIEEAQKKAMEFMKNNPQTKDIMEQIKAQEANKKVDRKKNEAVTEKENAIKKAKHMEEYYWRNKVASNTNGKFANWERGDVQIAYYNGKGKRNKDFSLLIEDYVVIGRINNEGVVTMNLPQTVKANKVISKGLFPEMHEIVNENVTFSNPDAPYFWYGYGLDVLQGGKSIGRLYLGNSERATHNLASPNIMYKYGDIGYLLYWSYVSEACTASADIVQNDFSFPHGENDIILDRNSTVELNFKAGWNMIKISVDEYSEQAGQKWFTNMVITTVTALPTDAKYYFKYNN